MKQGLLSWSHTTFVSLPFPPTLKPIIPKPKFSKITVTLNSVDESPATGRERRQMRKERREGKPAYNWKEEVEMKLIKKPKKRYASWTEELNLDTLALLGPQWWVVRVSRVSGHETAERMARLMARTFPDMEFKVYNPSVQIKRKLKNGTLSIKPKPLFPGCVFLKCVMNKEVHDFIRECDGVGGFIGSKVGNTKRQINKPRPVDEDDMEPIFKQAKEEQEKADQAFEEEQLKNEASDPKKLGVAASLDSQNLKQTNSSKKAAGRGRKGGKGTIEGPTSSMKLGSIVQVMSGAFAGFSGTLKKVDSKTGLVTVGFTLFGKETLADIDGKEIVAETN
ncbi:plastid transcriptionally active 13 [Perilla frutescens var. hirtella]|nr:plastid transcriptionally active 13 [Perilla frutescens var. hirtella]KAH6806278.1 plastid transcriptionally active 13 [Perilla frutescens var. frutescens]